MWRMVVVLGLLAPTSGLAEWVPWVARDDPAINGLRSCSRNLLMVDIPVHAALPTDYDTYSTTVWQRLNDAFGAGPASTEWNKLGLDQVFDPQYQKAICPPPRPGKIWRPAVQIEDVFAGLPLAQGCRGRTSCRRHQRIRFYCDDGHTAPEDSPPLAIKPGYECYVFAGIRQLFHDARMPDDPWSAWNTNDFYVGRDCSARAQQGEAWPTTQVYPNFIHDSTDPPAGTARVVMLEHSASEHGERVLSLLRTFSQNAFTPTLWLEREFDHLITYDRDLQIVGAPTSNIARALGLILAALPEIGEDPLVVNISLGWPPEFSRPWHHRVLPNSTFSQRFPDFGWEGGPACIESPAGEAVRHALVHLRSHAKTAVVAAAGNRVRTPGWDYNGDSNPRAECGAIPPPVETFYPAAFASVPTCVGWEQPPAGPGRPPPLTNKPLNDLVISVGQVGAGGDPGLGSLVTPTLHAPGKGVPVDGRLVSGTSFATAIAANTIARAFADGVGSVSSFLGQHTCIHNGNTLLSWNGGGRACSGTTAWRLPAHGAEHHSNGVHQPRAHTQRGCVTSREDVRCDVAESELAPDCRQEPLTLTLAWPGAPILAGFYRYPWFIFGQIGTCARWSKDRLEWPPHVRDVFHSDLLTGPQPPPYHICPDNNCSAIIAGGYGTFDFVGTIDSSIIDWVNSPGNPPYVVTHQQTPQPPKLVLYKNGGIITSWNLNSHITVWQGTVAAYNLVIPSGHRDNFQSDWEQGKYTIVLQGTVKESSQSTYHTDELLLALP